MILIFCMRIIIQNNLWDYDPHAENEESFAWDLKYDQIVPDDEYQGKIRLL